MSGRSGSGEPTQSHDLTNLPFCNRFHAWQSALLFAFLFVIHIIFSWSSILSWLIFVGDLGLIALLTFRAYADGKLL